jgi:hypothetical protein
MFVTVLENVCQHVSSNAAGKLWTKYLSRKAYTLQEILFQLECHISYLLFNLKVPKAFSKSRLSCAKIEVYHNVQHYTVHSLKYAHAGRFVFCCEEEKYVFVGLVCYVLVLLYTVPSITCIYLFSIWTTWVMLKQKKLLKKSCCPWENLFLIL